MKVVRDETTLQMLTIGFGKSIKKFDILSIEEEQRMLAQMICQPTSPSSLNLKFGYFGMLNFFIKECFELPYVDFDEFSLVSLFINVVLRFVFPRIGGLTSLVVFLIGLGPMLTT